MTDFFDPAFYLPVALGVIAVLLAGYALWRQIRDRTVSKSILDLLTTMRKEIREFQKPRTTTPAVSQSELRKMEALQWKNLTRIAKGIGWVLDQFGGKNEEEIVEEYEEEESD